jgi:intracellular sulfur oxidation DsrE/DsrF family protein
MHMERSRQGSSGRRGIGVLVELGLCLLVSVLAVSARPAQAQEIRIDIPVVLKEAKVVFNLDHLVFEGDEPTGLQFLKVMVPYFKRNATKATVVAIFHGDAGYMLLDDAAFNRVRNWQGGNPYKDQIAAFVRDGVQVEECGETMALRRWSNAELLPNVKVITGANYRIIQLVQDGYVQLQP